MRRAYNRTNIVNASDLKTITGARPNIFVEQVVRNGNTVDEKYAMYDFTSFNDKRIWAELTIPLITIFQFFQFSQDDVGVVRCYVKSLDEESCPARCASSSRSSVARCSPPTPAADRCRTPLAPHRSGCI